LLYVTRQRLVVKAYLYPAGHGVLTRNFERRIAATVGRIEVFNCTDRMLTPLVIGGERLAILVNASVSSMSAIR